MMLSYPSLSSLIALSGEYLYNSDVYIEVDNNTHDVTLIFLSSIKLRQITMKCQKVFEYTLIKIPIDNTAPFLVGEVQFTEQPLATILEKHHMMFPHAEEYLTILGIKIIGALDMTIRCLAMDYAIEEIA